MERIPNIGIAADRCVGCGRCVRVCPSMVFEMSGTEGRPVVAAPENCIGCSHCVAACPVRAVVHDRFPPERIRPVDRSLLPSPEQLQLLMRARRSNRDLTKRPVPQEHIDRILDAARYAPTASNLQQVGFTVVADPERLNLVVEYTLDFCRRMLRLLEMPLLGPVVRRFVKGADRYRLTFHRLIDEYEQHGRDRVLRGATALILFHTPVGNRFGAIDCQLAYQNGSLMAEALGVSQIYTGFVYTAIHADRKNRLARELGIEGTIHAGMALGMPVCLFPNYVEKG
ncbi:nitroreductase family protein [uncultured Alistipes sp.]|uniref:nitroreductase family protein n=1 Tax=uncultured Alistipes sp. TaxID=538949 RepID=UPI002619A3C5|nr:nitroreductase family protein [uncultured Alistipes sp.]